MATAPIRILHSLGGLDRSGVAAWLMTVLRGTDREQFRMDFLVTAATAGAHEDEARALGSKVIHCDTYRQHWRYARDLARVLREHGPYDIVHSHERLTGLTLLAMARQAGVPTRIAHSHNDLSTTLAGAGVAGRAYQALGRAWTLRHATAGLAASGRAAGVGCGWNEGGTRMR